MPLINEGLSNATGIANVFAEALRGMKEGKRYREQQDRLDRRDLRDEQRQDDMTKLSLVKEGYNPLSEQERTGLLEEKNPGFLGPKQDTSGLLSMGGAQYRQDPAIKKKKEIEIKQAQMGLDEQDPSTDKSAADRQFVQQAFGGLLPGFKVPETWSSSDVRKNVPILKERVDLQESINKRKQEGGTGPTGLLSPQGYQKLPAETKNKVSMAAEGLKSVKGYQKSFDEGQRQGYITPETKILGVPVGKLKSATDIDRYRLSISEAIGRLQSGGAISKEEENRFNEMIPRAGDTKDQSVKKLLQLEGMMGDRIKGLGVNDLKAAGLVVPEYDFKSAKESSGSPKSGEVVDGYEYLGGDPGSKSSWRKK